MILITALAMTGAYAAPLLHAPTATAAAVVGAVEAERLTLPPGMGARYADPAASAGSALGVWSTAAATGSVTTSAAAARMTVRARADLCGGAPKLEVIVDGTSVGTVTLSATTWHTLGFSGTWTAGPHSVSLGFPNDWNQPGTCDRNLHLDRVAFEAAASSPAVPGDWAVRQVVGNTAVTDTSGRVWSPATGLEGGHDMPAWGGIAGSASEQLYRTSRVGANSWTVRVPKPARYAVDLLTADSYGTAPGARVFDVLAVDGTGAPVTIATGVDVVATAKGWWAHHITGVVPVTSGSLVLKLVPRVGQPLVTGLSVQTYGPLEPMRTLFQDTFDGPAGAAANPAAWTPEVGPGPWGDGELQAYTDLRSNSSLDGAGHLAVTARRERYTDQYGSQDYTSARLITKGKVTFTYGHVEARLKVPAGAGLWPAFWSLGANKDVVDWPRSGELDVMEYLGSQPTMVFGHLHGLGDDADPRGWRDQPVSNVGRGYDTGTQLSAGWHTYGMDVQPDAVTFTIDGRQYATVSRADMRAGQQWPVGLPYYLLLNLAVGGTWGGPPTAATQFPATLLADHVRITS